MSKIVKSALLLLCFVSVNTYSQVLIGPTAGVNMNWFRYQDENYSDMYKTRPYTGFHVGGNVSFRVHNRFFLHTSLLYTRKGKSTEGLVDLMLRDKVTYSYLELPLLYTIEFKRTVGTNRAYKWYFGGGPTVSYWLGGKGTFQNSEFSEINVEKVDYKIVFKKSEDELGSRELNVTYPNRVQLGLGLGAGFVFEPAPARSVMLMIRYEIGHSMLSRDGEGAFKDIAEFRENLHARNNTFRVSLTYLIDTKLDQRKKGKSTSKITNTQQKKKKK